MARFEAGSRDIIEIAEQTGAPDALFELGLMYCSGRDVDLDMIEAHKWFNIAALRGNAEARRLRQEISREMSKNDIGAAQKRAREWLSRH
jgi:TPR repeat protein